MPRFEIHRPGTKQVRRCSVAILWRLVRLIRRAGTRPGTAGRDSNPSEKEVDMRVMVIVPGNKDSEAGVLPSKELLAEMGKFNEELVKAGVMLMGCLLYTSPSPRD